jgi:hypothetical protein
MPPRKPLHTRWVLSLLTGVQYLVCSDCGRQCGRIEPGYGESGKWFGYWVTCREWSGGGRSSTPQRAQRAALKLLRRFIRWDSEAWASAARGSRA